MTRPKLIGKSLKNLKTTPNLNDYQKEYLNFSYPQYHAELDWWPHHRLNAAYNAIDRHAQGERKNKVALYWHGPDDQQQKFTFLELSLLSNQFANILKQLKVGAGDRVFFFLPRYPELYYGFLGTLKIGAIAGTLFSAFGEQALEDRLNDADASVLVTNSELLPRVKKIFAKLPNLRHILVTDIDKHQKNCLSLGLLLKSAGQKLRPARTKPTDPAFMLYTSGTTGKPKGVIHQHYALLHEHLTAKWVLDIRDSDVYWCTADPGWVTGIAYEILGSWSNGASALVYAGRFSPEKWYQLIEQYKVNIWYTAPTAIRMLAAAGLEIVKRFDLSSLRHLASVGEPLNPEAIYWGLKAFGLPFHDNWWQTETGSIMIANFPCLDIRPGSMGKPVPGITAAILDDQGKPVAARQEGNLAIKAGWPSMMQKIWRRPQKYSSYFKKGWYISGDRAFQDKDGYFWFLGRADDVIKTSGERVGPFEVESALVSYPQIIEAAVIGKPDPLRGEIIKAFITLKSGVRPSEKLKEKIVEYVKKHLAGHAYPREIEFRDRLPKTRSGKIMRRLLKAQELGLAIGDTSTLEEF